MYWRCTTLYINKIASTTLLLHMHGARTLFKKNICVVDGKCSPYFIKHFNLTLFWATLFVIFIWVLPSLTKFWILVLIAWLFPSTKKKNCLYKQFHNFTAHEKSLKSNSLIFISAAASSFHHWFCFLIIFIIWSFFSNFKNRIQ